MPGVKRPCLFTLEEAVKLCERSPIRVDGSMKLTSDQWQWSWTFLSVKPNFSCITLAFNQLLLLEQATGDKQRLHAESANNK